MKKSLKNEDDLKMKTTSEILRRLIGWYTGFWQWFWQPTYPTRCLELGWAVSHSKRFSTVFQVGFRYSKRQVWSTQRVDWEDDLNNQWCRETLPGNLLHTHTHMHACMCNWYFLQVPELFEGWGLVKTTSKIKMPLKIRITSKIKTWKNHPCIKGKLTEYLSPRFFFI